MQVFFLAFSCNPFFRFAFISSFLLLALALHAKGRTIFNIENGSQDNNDADCNINKIILTPRDMLDFVDKFPTNELKNCCLAKYLQLFDKYIDT